MSLGNSNDSNLKDSWRSEGTENKKDWRKNVTEIDSSRRWREEERETGLLGGRRDRRKVERRADNIPTRETMDSRTLPLSDRWHDGSARRDSKWSSRWGPEEKEKEIRTEKKTGVDKVKEDAHNDNQSLLTNSRSTSEHDTDSRDKWRPRHRMEIHSGAAGSYRAAPGFGLGRGQVENSNAGFSVGRGRPNVTGRPLSAGSSGASEGVLGKPRLNADTLRYPRGKLLDIYRRQKADPSFVDMPNDMDELPPITQDVCTAPLAFSAPDAEEEV